MKTRTNEYTVLGEAKAQEYSVNIDGVIEIKEHTDLKAFFDGLLDVIIDYVEEHNALAGLSMGYEKYIEVDDFGDSDDKEGA